MKLAAFYIDTRRKTRYNDAIDLLEKCLLSRKLKYGEGDANVASLYFNLGYAHDLSKNFNKAMICYESAMNCEKASRTIIARSLSNKASILFESNTLDDALTLFSHALRVYDPSNQTPEEKGRIYLGQGQIYQKQRKLNEAMNCFDTALSIYKSTRSDCDENTARILQRIADVMIKEDNLQFAYQCAAEALEM
jgi:tetratricopeptide (TPR) repeat protein